MQPSAARPHNKLEAAGETGGWGTGGAWSCCCSSAQSRGRLGDAVNHRTCIANTLPEATAGIPVYYDDLPARQRLGQDRDTGRDPGH